MQSSPLWLTASLSPCPIYRVVLKISLWERALESPIKQYVLHYYLLPQILRYVFNLHIVTVSMLRSLWNVRAKMKSDEKSHYWDKDLIPAHVNHTCEESKSIRYTTHTHTEGERDKEQVKSKKRKRVIHPFWAALNETALHVLKS